jgi:phosphopantetheinyl transferase
MPTTRSGKLFSASANNNLTSIVLNMETSVHANDLERERLDLEREKVRLEREKLDMQQKQREHELLCEREKIENEREKRAHELKVLELKNKQPVVQNNETHNNFNLSHASKLVPEFNENNVEEFFNVFERIA